MIIILADVFIKRVFYMKQNTEAIYRVQEFPQTNCLQMQDNCKRITAV